MNSKLIFLYSDKHDVLINSAKTACDGLKGVQFVAIDSIVKDLHPEPWPLVIKNSFSPMLRNHFKDAIVANRVFNLDSGITRSELFRYGRHELWIHIAIMPLLNYAHKLIHDVGTPGTSKSLLPLNTQWALMSDFGRNDVAVPEFAYGFGAEEPDFSKLKKPIQKSVWSIFDWKVEKHLSKKEEEWNKFFVESPTGNPIICHYLGPNNYWFSYPHNESFTVNNDVFQKLVSRCNTCFESSVGEFLVYVEPDSGITRFYAFSPHLLNARSSEEFDSRVADWVSNITN